MRLTRRAHFTLSPDSLALIGACKLEIHFTLFILHFPRGCDTTPSPSSVRRGSSEKSSYCSARTQRKCKGGVREEQRRSKEGASRNFLSFIRPWLISKQSEEGLGVVRDFTLFIFHFPLPKGLGGVRICGRDDSAPSLHFTM